MHENVERIPRPPYPRHDFDPMVGAVHPSGSVFACVGGTVVNLRNSADGTVRGAAPLLEAGTSVAFSPDGATLLVGSYDHRVHALDVATLSYGAKTPAMYDAVEALALLGPRHVAAASSRGELSVYELGSMRLVHNVAPPDLDYAQLGGIAVTRDANHIVLAVGNTLTCFETASWQPVWTHVRPSSDYEPGRIAIAPDASWIAMGTREGLSFYDARTGRPGPVYRWTCAESVVWPGQDYGEWKPQPVFTADGSFVLVNNRVGNLVRIDARRLACAEEAPRQAGLAWIRGLELFPDGQHLFVIASDNSAAIWRLEPFGGLVHTRAVDPLPESAYDRLYADGHDDDFDDDDDYDDDAAPRR